MFMRAILTILIKFIRNCQMKTILNAFLVSASLVVVKVIT